MQAVPAPADTGMSGTGFTTFTFVDRHLDTDTGTVTLEYALDDMRLRESLRFPVPIPRRDATTEAALDLLHWVAGVSYWKAACPSAVRCAGRNPDRWQAMALNRLYREGLAEFAWHNRLDPQGWTLFDENPRQAPVPAPRTARLTRTALCAMGGGKDSLVALERLRALGETVITFSIGQAVLIDEVAKVGGVRHLRVHRQLAPELAQLNARGALNGHVPVTAINMAIGVLLALLHGVDSVVFANERSADEPTRLVGDVPVNHQFAKTFAWETLMDHWVRTYLATDLNCFSLLRRFSELAICREFAGLHRYHTVFSSCNRNFHLDGPRTRTRWCGRCPKCHFVFLGLAPFVPRARMVEIFGHDLLDDAGQEAGFRALMAFDGAKPFECVGEAREARAALAALTRIPEWQNRFVVHTLAGVLDGMEVETLEALLVPSGPHRIPQRFRDAG